MRIKSLELSGFKSFVDRTVVNFEEGVTGIVGPNGCGKSNVVDAIRWVMGEMSAKHLRGSAMEDVIFSGCDTRPAVGMSQVFLTFDNSDGRAPAEYSQYSEIQVGRRLYRSGESEYFINKTQCRLKDIIDLFLGTGIGTKAYSIVEQGMVGSIVSSKPEDRRHLIEEAAGISKFKARKEAALRKMESTRQNLARLSDILAELGRQMNSLNRQAKKAERYQKVFEELRSRELSLTATRYRVLRTELEHLTQENARLREEEMQWSASLSQKDAELSTYRMLMSEVEMQLDQVQQDLYRAEQSIKLTEADIQHKLNERDGLAKRSVEFVGELEAMRSRKGEYSTRMEAANCEMVAADMRLAGSEEVVAAIEAEVDEVKVKHRGCQQGFDEVNRAVMTHSEMVANFSSSVEHLERRYIDIAGRIARDQSEIDAIDRRRADIDGEYQRITSELDSARQLKLDLTNEAEAAQSTLDQQRAALADADGRVRQLKDDVADRNSKLESILELRKNLEGYRDGVKAVLSRTDSEGSKYAGIMGTVSELVDTKPEYETALGAALGEKLQCVVVKSHSEGVEAIEYLQSAACGRSAFIPMEVHLDSRADEGTLEGDGVVGPLSNYVSFSDSHRMIGEALLRDVVLVEDLHRALGIWQNGSKGKTLVTRDGCVVDPAGMVSGGAGGSVEEHLIVQKRRAKELDEELRVLRSELSQAEAEASRFRDRVRHMEESVERLKSDSHSEELKFLGQERDSMRIRDDIARYERERDKLSIETAALSEELKEVEFERDEAKSGKAKHEAERAQAQERFAAMKQELESLSAELSRREAKLINFRVELAQANERAVSVGRELENLIKSKAELEIGIGRRMAEISAANIRSAILDREVESQRIELDLNIRSIARLEESRNVLSARHEQGQNSIRDRELSMREMRNRHNEVTSSYHEVELKLTSERGRCQYLVDGVRERYHFELAAIEAEYAKDDLNLDEEEIAVAGLKEKIESIGSVNVDAIKEYDELTGRHDFLTRQHGDLALSLDNLSKAITKINRTSRARFRRAFDAVDEQFQLLFPKLFRGGKARLMLTDEENLLETGVEIVAQPPGKKLQSITLLSGGEKALTAVALIFSIFLIKPSPFCLLDEVDAPLDDANIDRFNDLIRSMTPHSQFILITHNKRTMELADVLYGVTMEEAGCSKLVSVRLGQDKEEPQIAVA